MTKFINCSDEQKETKETVFTHYLDGNYGWQELKNKPSEYDSVIYLGKCDSDEDMFACNDTKHIFIHKGTKGDEF